MAKKQRYEEFEPEQIVEILASSSELLTPERLEIAKRLSREFMRDPALMQTIERTLRANGADLNRVMPKREELASFGWTDEALALPSPKQAAAAAAAGAAAMIIPVPVPV